MRDIILRVLTALTLAGAMPVLADEWTLARAQGQVEAQLSGAWQAVTMGATINDGTLVRTGFNGRATLVRGKESVSLSPMTMLVIHDRDGQRFTDVLQMTGQVEVEAEARNVQHFAVDTPYLAAVVKGTHFTVTVQHGKAGVDVSRGVVSVSDNQGKRFAVPAGQAIQVTKAGAVTKTSGVTSGPLVTPPKANGGTTLPPTPGADGVTGIPSGVVTGASNADHASSDHGDGSDNHGDGSGSGSSGGSRGSDNSGSSGGSGSSGSSGGSSGGGSSGVSGGAGISGSGGKSGSSGGSGSGGSGGGSGSGSGKLVSDASASLCGLTGHALC